MRNIAGYKKINLLREDWGEVTITSILFSILKEWTTFHRNALNFFNFLWNGFQYPLSLHSFSTLEFFSWYFHISNETKKSFLKKITLLITKTLLLKKTKKLGPNIKYQYQVYHKEKKEKIKSIKSFLKF